MDALAIRIHPSTIHWPQEQRPMVLHEDHIDVLTEWITAKRLSFAEISAARLVQAELGADNLNRPVRLRGSDFQGRNREAAFYLSRIAAHDLQLYGSDVGGLTA